jgi:hypothetical protein
MIYRLDKKRLNPLQEATIEDPLGPSLSMIYPIRRHFSISTNGSIKPKATPTIKYL